MSVSEILARIQNDLDALREHFTKDTIAATPKTTVVPVLRNSYTATTAKNEKDRIEAAFAANLIDYDKKRGLKMLVTKRTVGWSPVKSAA